MKCGENFQAPPVVVVFLLWKNFFDLSLLTDRPPRLQSFCWMLLFFSLSFSLYLQIEQINLHAN